MDNRLAKDVHQLLKSIDSFSNGQARVTGWDSDDLEHIEIELLPSDGPYKGGRFEFKLTMRDGYPSEAPGVTCKTNVYHPNIDPTCCEDNVCLSLFGEWEETFRLEDCVQGLLFLFYEPNLEDPLSPFFEPILEYEEFVQNVKVAMRGGEVEMNYFDNCLVDDEANDAVKDILDKLVNVAVTGHEDVEQSIENGKKDMCTQTDEVSHFDDVVSTVADMTTQTYEDEDLCKAAQVGFGFEARFEELDRDKNLGLPDIVQDQNKHPSPSLEDDRMATIDINDNQTKDCEFGATGTHQGAKLERQLSKVENANNANFDTNTQESVHYRHDSFTDVYHVFRNCSYSGFDNLTNVVAGVCAYAFSKR